MKQMERVISTLAGAAMSLTAGGTQAQTLPPPKDIPEEVLLNEIITEARSPIDGSPLTAAEYAELQAQLRIAAEDVPGRVSPRIQTNISLLRVLKILKTLLPFVGN
ncbi:MAG: hypothetical protein ACFCU8_20010 [Thermosynechococcaceae cyanobacterium]